MPTTKQQTIRARAQVVGLKRLDVGPGMWSAYISVFRNLDLQNQRVAPGAFAGSLSRWAESPNPRPVIFSHQWDDVKSHIGENVSSEEIMPGDARLPGEIREYGGLNSTFRLDVGEPDTVSWARRIDTLLDKGRITQFSFAYDVLDARRLDDGSIELLELDILEEGPTLFGANPLTQLASRAPTEERFYAMLDAKSADDFAQAIVDGPGAPAEQPAAKAWVDADFAGSLEERQGAVFDAVVDQAVGDDMGSGGFYAAELVATFDATAIVRIEGWNDPLGGGDYFEVGYTLTDGAAVIGDEWTEVSFNVTAEAKSARRNRSAKRLGVAGTVADDAKIKSEEPSPPPTEGQQVKVDGSGAKPEERASSDRDRLSLEIDILELG